MSDNLPTSVQLDSNQNGSVSFATEVVATIAGLAANEVEGVAGMYGGSTGIAGIWRGKENAKNLTKGVKVEFVGGKLMVLVSIVVDYGSAVPDVAQAIQENVKKAIETMSGLEVGNVDVHVQAVSFEKENQSVAEIEMQQKALLMQHQDKSAIGGEKAPDMAIAEGVDQDEPDEIVTEMDDEGTGE